MRTETYPELPMRDAEKRFGDINGTPAKAETEKRKTTRMSDAEHARVSVLLIQNAVIDFEEKLVTYALGWNDAKIAEIIAGEPGRKHIKARHVAEFRLRGFGETTEERAAARAKLAPQKSVAHVELENAMHIQALRKRVEALEAKFARLYA